MCSVILRARRAKKAADGYTIATAGCNFRNGTDDRPSTKLDALA